MKNALHSILTGKNWKTILLSLSLLFCLAGAYGQKGKVWFDGQGRGYFTLDQIGGDFRDADTLTPKNANGGYTLLDLGFNVNPNDQVHVNTIIRARNEFGGFWGAGTVIELRQLYVRGIVGKVVHYGVGDLYLNQSRFTLHNYQEEGSVLENGLMQVYKDVVHYENFYRDNDWRMQGMQSSFVLDFDRFVRSAEVEGFLARNRGAVFGGLPDMLFGGGSVKVQQSEKFAFGANFVSLFEVPSTTNATTAYHNPVLTGTAEFNQPLDTMNLRLFVEGGFSNSVYKGDTLSPEPLNDFFVETGAELKMPVQDLTLKLLYRQVGAGFRSPGAQTRRFNYNSISTIYPRYTLTQQLRPTTLHDLLTEEGRYRRGLSQTLTDFDPKYNNSNPYGDATPNRAGVHLEMDYQPESEVGEASVNAGYAREMVGQGTEELKNFVLITATGKLNINKLIGWDNKLELAAGIRQENTSRGGDSLEQVNLASTLVDAGITVEIIPKLELIGGAKWFNAAGNEYLTLRNNYGEVNDFPVYVVDQQESIWGAGLKYNFNEQVYFTVQGNWIGVEDRTDNIEDYNINRLLVLFNMKF